VLIKYQAIKLVYDNREQEAGNQPPKNTHGIYPFSAGGYAF
jgi:hypothetical protein